MPLATQCPHCQTTFRVANDQLKLHAGLVRCGACQQTFNGVEHLLAPGARPAPVKAAEAPLPGSAFEMPEYEQAHEPTHSPVHVPLPDELEFPANTIPTVIETQDQGESTPVGLIQKADSVTSSSALDFDLGQDEPFAQSEAVPLENPAHEVEEPEVEEPLSQSEPVAAQAELDDPEELEAQQEIGLIEATEAQAIEENANASDVMPEAAPEAATLADREDSDGISDETTDEATDEVIAEVEPDAEKPIFVVQAEKKQRRSRITRIFMLLFSVLLFLTLLAQTTYGMRHQIAAWFPQTKPTLQEACKLLRCRIDTPAQIDMISIESNELQALVTDGNIFSLALQLQNKSGTIQNWPMLELTLNDSKEQTVLRRVFTPAEYLANKNDLIKGFAPASEQNIKLHFELTEVKAAGYHVSVFYP